MMKSFALAAVTLLLAAPVHAVTAPTLKLASLKDLPVVETHPYDEHADANAAVAAAFAKARVSHKRVLIDLGGNWCGDCLVLANLMQLPELKRFLKAHYEIVSVDVGRFTRNLQIPARYGITTRLEGVPAFLVVTTEGKLVNTGRVSAIQDARHMTPQALADWLAQWTN